MRREDIVISLSSYFLHRRDLIRKLAGYLNPVSWSEVICLPFRNLRAFFQVHSRWDSVLFMYLWRTLLQPLGYWYTVLQVLAKAISVTISSKESILISTQKFLAIHSVLRSNLWKLFGLKFFVQSSNLTTEMQVKNHQIFLSRIRIHWDIEHHRILVTLLRRLDHFWTLSFDAKTPFTAHAIFRILIHLITKRMEILVKLPGWKRQLWYLSKNLRL